MSYIQKIRNALVGGPREVTVGVVRNTAQRADPHHVSYTKIDVLMLGVSVRALANVKF